jgi:PilZ domain-containing protein/TonB-like protein
MCNLQEYLKDLTPARDRRLKTRVTPKSLVYVSFGDTDGIVVNASETGMALAVGRLATVGDYPICIRFQLPTSSQSIGISARVVRLTESKKGVGVRLVDLGADASAEIANWIASEKSAAELGQPAQLLHRNEQPLEIGSRKSRRIFSNPSVREEEAAARYAEMFPSESTYAKHPRPVDENKLPQDPIPIPVKSGADPGDSMLRSAAQISTGDPAQTRSLPQAQTVPELVAPSASHTPFIFDLSGLQVAALVFLFAVIGLIIGIAATKASVDVLASLGRGPFGRQVRLRSQSPHTQSASGPPSDSAPSVTLGETSSAQTSRPSVELDSSAGANTVGSARPPEEKAKEGTRGSEPSVKVPSSRSNSSTTIESKPSADPEGRPERRDLTGIIARSVAPPANAEHAHSAVAVGPIRSAPRNHASHTAKAGTAAVPKSSSPPATSLKHAHPAMAGGSTRSASRNRALLTARPTSGTAPKSSSPTASSKRSHPAVAGGPKGTESGNAATHTAKPAATAAPAPSPQPASPKPKNPTVAEGPKGVSPGNPIPPTATPAPPAAPNPPPPANSEPTNPIVAEGPKGAAPGSPAPGSSAPLTAKPPAAAEPKPPTPSSVVTVPSKGGKAVKVIFPQKQIAFSPSLAITTQLSVVVPPESGPAAAQPSRLQAGKLLSYVLPRNPRPEDRYGAEETVKVRATIGQQGLVTEIRPVSGPIFLLSSTVSAVRLWRYKPTLLNGTPIETHQDVTIIFKVAR